MQGAVVHLGDGGARITRGADLPLEAMMVGRPVTEVAETLPRLFNLCRMAQGTAARLALGLSGAEDPTPEILRDHGAKLQMTLRQSLGLPPLPPRTLTPETLFGPAGRLPETLSDLSAWLTQPLPTAALLREIAALFPPQVATTRTLPPPVNPLAPEACENSAAGRQAHRPLMQAVDATQGRGPLWRVLGLLADAEAALAGRLPKPCLQGDVAVVPAARGVYALRITQAQGRVTSLTRRTPTDHILAPGGVLEQALSRLHPSLAPIVIALHDPCMPVTIREAADA